MSQSQRPSMNANQSQQAQDVDTEIDLLLEQISNAKNFIVPMTKTFFENNINFNTPFTNETKDALKDKMAEFLKLEDQLKIQQRASLNLQFAGRADDDNAVGDDLMNKPIEELLESADLKEQYNQMLDQLKAENTYNPFEDDQYKNLLNLLGEENNVEDDGEGLEMLQTDFTIPIDPFGKQEISNPVRNKVCKHLYDKDNFIGTFENIGRSVIKCPFTGCTNKNVTINDVVEDERMKILIDNAKRQQS